MVRISEFVRKQYLAVLAENDINKVKITDHRRSDFTLIVFQPLNGSPFMDSINQDAIALQFNYHVNGLVLLRHNDNCFHC